MLNGVGARQVHDALVQRWELALFGTQASVTWWQSAPSRFWSTVLHAAYFSYYLIVLLPALYFVGRGKTEAVRHFVLSVMAVFVFCYLVFIFFPVAGPYYQFPPPPAWFTDNLPARLVYATLSSGSSYGAAFPSSHVAATVAAALRVLSGVAPPGAAAHPAHDPAHRGRGLLPDALRGGRRRRPRRRLRGGMGARPTPQPRPDGGAIPRARPATRHPADRLRHQRWKRRSPRPGRGPRHIRADPGSYWTVSLPFMPRARCGRQ